MSLFKRNIRRTITFCVHLCFLSAAAQGWDTHWIHHPGAADGEQVWFRRTFTDNCQAITEAYVKVASGGRFMLFVNGYNASTDILTPDGGQPSDTLRTVTYDVTHLLRPDTNVVAVWYAPTESRLSDRRQLSLTFYGRTSDGTEGQFAHVTDSTWMCRTNGCCTRQDGGETVDATAWTPDWNTAGGSPMGWQWAEADEADGSHASDDIQPARTSWRTARIRPYSLTTTDGTTMAYGCGRRFYGQVRVTLRGMRRGDRISVDGLEYVCAGRDDEQACRRFTAIECGAVTISGERLKPENITNVEGIAIQPYVPNGWIH